MSVSIGWRYGTVVLTAVALALPLGACAANGPAPTPSQTGIAPASASPTADRPDPSPPSADNPTVNIQGNSFGPSELTVAVGDVTFVNDDAVPHTVTEGEDGVTAPDARFNVVVPAGESARVPFDEPGDYLITCLFHSEMRLLVHAH